MNATAACSSFSKPAASARGPRFASTSATTTRPSLFRLPAATCLWAQRPPSVCGWLLPTRARNAEANLIRLSSGFVIPSEVVVHEANDDAVEGSLLARPCRPREVLPAVLRLALLRKV